MIAKLLNRVATDLLSRLLLTGVVILVPVAITVNWLSAAYYNILWGKDFWVTFWELFLYGASPILPIGLACLYIIERWIIRDRARSQFRWVLVRILLYMLSGLPEGFATLLGIRWGMGRVPAQLEFHYFVQTTIMAVVVALLYTLGETAITEFQKRTNQLNQQIHALRIEVDELKRRQQVDEILNTDFFQDLQKKAVQLRKSRMEPGEE